MGRYNDPTYEEIFKYAPDNTLANAEDFSPFLGICLSKACIERKDARKKERHQTKLEAIQLRKAPAFELAKQGIVAPSGLAQALSIGGNLISTLTGHGNTGTMGEEINQAKDAGYSVGAGAEDQNLYNNGIQGASKNKSLPYIIGGAVLLFVVLLVLILKKKK